MHETFFLNSHLHSHCLYSIQLLTEHVIASCQLSHPSIRSLSRLNCDIYTLSRNYLQTSNKCLMIFVVATLSVAAGQHCECCNKWFGKKVILSINGTLIWCNHRPSLLPHTGHGVWRRQDINMRNMGNQELMAAKQTLLMPHLLSLSHTFMSRGVTGKCSCLLSWQLPSIFLKILELETNEPLRSLKLYNCG